MFLEFINDLIDKTQILQQMAMNEQTLKTHVELSNKVKKIHECIAYLKEVDKILREIKEHPDEKEEEIKEVLNFDLLKYGQDAYKE